MLVRCDVAGGGRSRQVTRHAILNLLGTNDEERWQHREETASEDVVSVAYLGHSFARPYPHLRALDGRGEQLGDVAPLASLEMPRGITTTVPLVFLATIFQMVLCSPGRPTATRSSPPGPRRSTSVSLPAMSVLM